MKKKRGPMGAIMGMLGMLAMVGIFLAVLSQFGGDLGEMFRWFLNAAWKFVITVRDTIAGWDTFQGLFGR